MEAGWIIALACMVLGMIIMAFSSKKSTKASGSVGNGGAVLPVPAPPVPVRETKYYINFEGDVYGPFTLTELKSDYPILEDTLITTDTLNGEWYEAQCFECFDDLLDVGRDFKINEFGEIVRH